MSPPTIQASTVDYSKSIDFHELVQIDSRFKQLLVDNHGRMDWKDPQHLMQLTKCLLKRDFGLSIDLPDDRLCPPVPGRFSYIEWIASLLDTTSETFMETYEPERQVTGIDIGTGASCIYPLLGTALRPNWRFYATELDEKSYSYATTNVKNNKLDSRIRVLKINPLEAILSLDRHGISKADFTMCNPPFFSSHQEMMSTYDKAEPPSAVCTGAETEMITEGGDAGFVTRMVEESKTFGARVQWYTSMLGKLSSVATVVHKVQELGCNNWAVGCLLTGGKTKRWVVGWSWIDLRPTSDVARCSIPHKDVLPFPTDFTIHVTTRGKQDLMRRLNEVLNNLDLVWQWRSSISAGLVLAGANVWSRAARRKKQQQAMALSPADDRMDIDTPAKRQSQGMALSSEEAALAVKITIHEERVDMRWLKGSNTILFESFCGMIKREITK